MLIVTSVEAEAKAIGAVEGATIVIGGIGRTNAAAAVTEAIIRRGPFDAVICAGIAGALPDSGLKIGEAVVASRCIYMEEGLVGPHGFADMAAMGFSLGDFEGNAVPVDSRLLDLLGERFPIGSIATVATCSGTDAAAREVVRRTGAMAEAMEGAAVVHAARRLKTPAIELRTISNMTGDRARQKWDIPAALAALGQAMATSMSLLRSNAGG
jgi:futalosine hydrolase